MQRANLSVVVTHIASWLLFLSLPVICITSESNNITATDVLLSPYYWLCFAFFISLFYLHTYLLFPLLYRQKKRWLYIVIVAVLFMFLLWLQPFDKLMSNWHRGTPQQVENLDQLKTGLPPRNRFQYPGPPPPNENQNNELSPHNQFDNQPPSGDSQNQRSNRIDIVSIFMFMVIMAISISTDVSKRLRIAAESAAKAEADKANAELSVLKAQVNPHFLFNTLNNIYSLATTQDENTAESILKLSNIMRYVTDDAPEDFVPLQKEWDCISDFIDLQKLRIGSKVSLSVSVQGDLSNRMIAPFILLTFVENIFKYGISNNHTSHISIKLSVINSAIEFVCSNPVSEVIFQDRKSTGIINVKKRLSYLYADSHSLNISESNNLYTVQLVLKDNCNAYDSYLHRH